MIESCTIANNTCVADRDGGGIYHQNGYGYVTNTIVYGNKKGVADQNIDGTGSYLDRYWYSCATELTEGVQGNIVSDPRFVSASSGNYTLDVGSPCKDAGTNLLWMTTNAVDLAGDPRLQDANGDSVTNVDMGCYEAMAAGTGPLRCSFSAAPVLAYLTVDAIFTASVDGLNTNITWYGWDFDGDMVWDRQGTGMGVVTQSLGIGHHTVVLSVSNSAVETAFYTNADCVIVYPVTYYVATNGSHTLPYNSWANAGTNIHDVVTYAYADGSTSVLVRVAAGTYNHTDYVNINKPMTVRSEEGPLSTIVRWPGATDRAVKISDANAVFDGFTVRDSIRGGFRVEGGLVNNCWAIHNKISGNGTDGPGMLITGGLVTHSLIGWNTNGAHLTLSHAGGAEVRGGMLAYSVIRSNTTYGGIGYGGGGGVLVKNSGHLRNCLVVGNQAMCANNIGNGGGGVAMADGGIVESCTIVDNSCHDNDEGGGIWITRTSGAKPLGTVTNTIVSTNYSGIVADDVSFSEVDIDLRFSHSCAPELAAGQNGNITNAPLFIGPASGEYGLDAGSPGENAGTNLSWMVDARDLANAPRLAKDLVDMGAYEIQPYKGTLLLLW